MPLIDVADLTIAFGAVPVVKGVTFQIAQGEALGIVGESGSGKSVTAQALVLPVGTIQKGTIFFDGENLLEKNSREWQAVRRKKIGMVFQEPLTALNPLIPIGKQITEGGARDTRNRRRSIAAGGLAQSPLNHAAIPSRTERRNAAESTNSDGFGYRP